MYLVVIDEKRAKLDKRYQQDALEGFVPGEELNVFAALRRALMRMPTVRDAVIEADDAALDLMHLQFAPRFCSIDVAPRRLDKVGGVPVRRAEQAV